MKNGAEIVCIGNELLIGQTLDTNSNWIARQLNKLGWSLQRVTLLRDSPHIIGLGIGEALKRTPALLITVGGLGPTHDDMTLKGLSKAVHRPLVLSDRAQEMIKKKYESIDAAADMTSSRQKMALLPKKSEPLPNPVGTAPGVLTRTSRTIIVSLPGVPDEMKAIFKGSVEPFLRKSSMVAPEEVYLRLVGIIESALAPILKEAQRRFPALYFKSHPKGRETGVRSLIQMHIYTIEGKNRGLMGEAIGFLVKSLADQI